MEPAVISKRWDGEEVGSLQAYHIPRQAVIHGAFLNEGGLQMGSRSTGAMPFQPMVSSSSHITAQGLPLHKKQEHPVLTRRWQ